MTLESLCRVTCNGVRGEGKCQIRELEVSKSKLREAEGRGLEVTLNTNGIWVELITVLCKCNDSILIIAKWGPQNSTHKRVGPVGQKCVIPCGRHAMPALTSFVVQIISPQHLEHICPFWSVQMLKNIKLIIHS